MQKFRKRLGFEDLKDATADRGRFWLGQLTDVRKKETNYSAPFSFPEFDPDKI